ncbi:hypothetical protein QAD02_023961 [Eretmocerus hayati]|uniref:Uncharacterized protein n=1 Tax=Eretmocerus hayati TaxID=131215 RepID=A0ACC2PZI9_9HYME|nr:hypothetical protein QAD02_023961 [Eretmocerus hayati]
MLKNGFRINDVVPSLNPLKDVILDLIGSSAVHYAYSKDLSGARIPFLDSKVLVSHEANFTLTNAAGMTSLHLSIEKSLKSWMNVMTHEGIRQALMMHISMTHESNPTNNYGLSHLHIACIAGHALVVAYSLNNGFSPNDVIDPNSSILPGYSALHLAACFGSLETIQLLLKHGADVHLQNSDGLTPLELIFERLVMVKSDRDIHMAPVIEKFKLLSYHMVPNTQSGKVNINSLTVEKLTPLNFFLKGVKNRWIEQNSDILEYFLESGALINTKALKDALEADDTSAYQILIDEGAGSFIIRDGEENAMHEIFKGLYHDLDRNYSLDKCLEYIRSLSHIGFDIDS